MMKIFVTIIAIFFVDPIMSQHLIGKNKEEISKEMKIHYPNFLIDNTSVNHTYKYLKYVNDLSGQTMLIFLSDQNECTSIKLMSDYSNLNQVKAELNKKYKSNRKDQWTYKVDNEVYLIKLKREEWFFSVFTTKK